MLYFSTKCLFRSSKIFNLTGDEHNFSTVKKSVKLHMMLHDQKLKMDEWGFLNRFKEPLIMRLRFKLDPYNFLLTGSQIILKQYIRNVLYLQMIKGTGLHFYM